LHAHKLCGGGRNILPQPRGEIFKGEFVGLVKPRDETVHRFGIGGFPQIEGSFKDFDDLRRAEKEIVGKTVKRFDADLKRIPYPSFVWPSCNS
jgi:hypothetical protein